MNGLQTCPMCKSPVQMKLNSEGNCVYSPYRDALIVKHEEMLLTILRRLGQRPRSRYTIALELLIKTEFPHLTFDGAHKKGFVRHCLEKDE